MRKLKTFILIIIALGVSILFSLEKDQTKYYGATDAYRVYLNGKSVGIINSKKKLENYINEEEQSIKDKFNVSNIYIPKGLKIEKELTYNENVYDSSEIYNFIKGEEPFTIEGYKVTIVTEEQQENKGDGSNTEAIKKEKYVYVLNKKILTDAIDDIVLSFVDADKYNAYLEENQEEIVDTGEIIENIFIKEEIRIKKDYIPVDENIFTNSKDLSSYLLFGKVESSKKYKVKQEDTLESIANKNKLSVQELLILNKDLSEEAPLLWVGQELVIDIIDPIITVVEEIHEVQRQAVKFKTETIQDNSMYVGYSKIVQEGKNGENRITQKVTKENGDITNVYITETEVLSEPINKIIKYGKKAEFIVATTEFWGWPTKTPYRISDYYRWRWGKMHTAIDITGTGHGSPIYAANDGTVITAEYHWSFGNYVQINHNNGYITLYAHLSKIYVQKGQGVHRGDVIGTMGSTGFSTGTHLHYAVKKNGKYIDPFDLYQ